MKIKTVEALQYGVPTVATSVGAEGIDLRGTAALLVADDARDFARGLISLLTDRVANRSLLVDPYLDHQLAAEERIRAKLHA